MTDFTLELQPTDYLLTVEAANRDPVVVDYPQTVLAVTVNSDIPPSAVTVARYIFTTPALTWVVKHNKETEFIQAFLYDQEGRPMLARMTQDSLNQMTIYFTTPETGRVDVIFGNPAALETVYVT